MDPRAYTWRPDAVAASDPHRFCSGHGVLQGLRLVVKDLFDIAGLPTTAGNPDWAASHPIPQTTAPLVRQLLDAGAVLTGKTLTDELAYSLNGQNIHYGTPANPCAPGRLPGGSSSGSAVAVAAGDADIGLGTDTGGSIRVPSSYNGLFGLRPSHGVLSLAHTVPLAPRFDTAGWMCRDAQTLWRVGETLLPPEVSAARWPECIDGAPVRLAVLMPERTGALWREAHEQWLAGLRDVEIVRRVPVASEWLDQASECFRVLQGREIWRTHGDWVLAQRPRFAPDIQARFDWAKSLTKADEAKAEAESVILRAGINGWLTGVDAVIVPTTPGPAPYREAPADWMATYRSQLMGLTAPAGLAGLPQLHLPVLTEEAAPMGVSVLGARGHDRRLLALARRWCASPASSLKAPGQ